MTDATELKKIVKQLQSAGTEPVIDFFFLVSMSFVYLVQADVPVFSSFLLAGNHRYSPCHEEEFPSERGRPQSGDFFSSFYFTVVRPLTHIHQESKAGLAVGKLRTHSQKAVSDLAKEIVKEWKAEVERAKNKAAPLKQGCTYQFQCHLSVSRRRRTNDRSPPIARKTSVSSVPATPITPIAPNRPKSEDRTAQSDKVNIELTGNKTRDKCIELIYDGLACDSTARGSHLLVA